VTGVTLSSETNSPPFPITPGAFDKTINSTQDSSFPFDEEDAFVTKIDASGAAWAYSTYLGGDGRDEGRGIAIDGNGNAYITGFTHSDDFPTQNAFQPSSGVGLEDAFLTKLNAAGNALVYSTYLGGNNLDYGNGIAIDTIGNAYVTGRTNSANFPTKTPFQGPGGWDDAFVSKFDASGTALIYSTYLGGGSDDIGQDVAVDTAGNAYVIGWTWSTNFPLQNPLQSNNAGRIDVFVTKFSATGTALIYSTYLGGSNDDVYQDDRLLGIAVDTAGSAYITGGTSSIDFPTQNAFQGQNTSGGLGVYYDAFVAKISDTALLPSLSISEVSIFPVEGSLGDPIVQGVANSTQAVIVNTGETVIPAGTPISVGLFALNSEGKVIQPTAFKTTLPALAPSEQVTISSPPDSPFKIVSTKTTNLTLLVTNNDFGSTAHTTPIVISPELDN